MIGDNGGFAGGGKNPRNRFGRFGVVVNDGSGCSGADRTGAADADAFVVVVAFDISEDGGVGDEELHKDKFL